MSETHYAIAVRVLSDRPPVYLGHELRWTPKPAEAHVFTDRIEADRALAWAKDREPNSWIETIADLDDFRARESAW